MKKIKEILARMIGTLIAVAVLIIAPILVIFILANPPKECNPQLKNFFYICAMADPIIIHAFYVEKPTFVFLRLIHPPIEDTGLAGKRGKEPRCKPKTPT